MHAPTLLCSLSYFYSKLQSVVACSDFCKEGFVDFVGANNKDSEQPPKSERLPQDVLIRVKGTPLCQMPDFIEMPDFIVAQRGNRSMGTKVYFSLVTSF